MSKEFQIKNSREQTAYDSGHLGYERELAVLALRGAVEGATLEETLWYARAVVSRGEPGLQGVALRAIDMAIAEILKR